jgi:acyl-CoA synthetase (AMP-forming)/AMP-acid ligase II
VARRGRIPIGYHRAPELTAERFVTLDGERWVITGDHATVEADGSIVLLGRGSSCINTGGEKVHPEEVEAVLKASPDVYDCLVVGVPDERWGQAVAAVVQPAPGSDIDTTALQAHCRSRLAGYKVPKSIHLVQRVERSPSGKPDLRWAARVATTAG